MEIMSILAAGLALASCSEPLTNAASLRIALENDVNLGRTFSMEGQVIFQSGEVGTIFGDSSGFIPLRDEQAACRTPGDRLKITGRICRGSFGMLHPALESATFAGRGETPEPVDVSIADYTAGKCDMRLVRLRGRLLDVFRDEIDLGYLTIILQSGSDTVISSVYTKERNRLDEMLGTEVTLSGFCSSREYGARRMIRRTLVLPNIEAIQPSSASSPDIFAAAPLRPAELPEARPARRCAEGRVVAAWGKNNILLRLAGGNVMHVTLFDQALPAYGTDIEVSGFVETDLYRVNLSHAKWRRSANRFPVEPEPEDAKPSMLHFNQIGTPGIDPTAHGRAVRLRGTVLGPPAEDGCFKVKWGDDILTIDASETRAALNGVVSACIVQVEGICVMETENWRPGNAFPHIQRVLIVIRTPGDIRILANPPWWTTPRVLAIIGTLLAALLGILLWNVSLNHRAEQRGRELAEEQIAHVASELKVNERTRLAVELHDSLSQTLAGVSMQIDTAAGIVQKKEPAAKRCLDIASRTIDSCRMELRNTLWDLRSAALDEPDMNEAIRKTLRQNLAGLDLSVRFNVPRDKFSDNTAHAILKIIRELAANAIRHGKPSSITIDGSLKDGILSFSVVDDGRGFDPDLAPGVSEGHFGLQGIAERLELLDGEMTIDSAPGQGTRINVKLKMEN